MSIQKYFVNLEGRSVRTDANVEPFLFMVSTETLVVLTAVSIQFHRSYRKDLPTKDETVVHARREARIEIDARLS